MSPGKSIRICATSDGLLSFSELSRATNVARENSVTCSTFSCSDLAAGYVLQVAEKVAKGELDSAFAIVRPPGHHAEQDQPKGFCLFNNVAIATQFLLDQKELGINKILIVDWDVHHGNGTQKMFWKDPRVLFFSVHRHEHGNFYPYGDDGSHLMIGEGPGLGYNINVPWENDQCGDADYVAAWDHILIPVAKEFKPDIILISAGFDAAIGDPLGKCRVTPNGYTILLKKLMEFSSGKIVMALEGGYNLTSLANSVLACVELLLDDKPITESTDAYPFESTWRVIKAVREELSSYWPVLADKLPEKLPSYVLNGRCPYELVYKKKSSLSHLRDLKFYKTVFPFKMKANNSKNLVSDSESDHLSFFYNIRPQSPNDEGKTSSVEDGSCLLLRNRTIDNINLYQEEVSAIQIDDHSLSEGNVDSSDLLSPTQIENMFDQDSGEETPGLRRSSRRTKVPARFNGYVVSSNANYFEALKDGNWVEAMNNEIETLNRNNTWSICVLPPCIKPIVCKWLFKIKYIAYGEIERYEDRLVEKGFSQIEGFDDNNGNKVCKLNKSLYGLKQAPRQWNAKLTTALAEHGFVQSKFDYFLYMKSKGIVFVALRVYDDDIVITRNDESGIKDFKTFLSNKFQIKDLGELKYFLGIEVLKNDKGMCLSQRKLYMELLYEYGLLAARPVETPLPENTVPLQSHFKAALRVLRYLKQSPGLGLQFNKASNLKLKDFSNADWAKCPKTKRSVTGYCVFLGQSLVSWMSKRQSTISRSSVEAGYRSMASTTCKLIWLENLLHNLGLKNLYPVDLFCDSSSAIQIAANPMFHEKTKHFELDVHLIIQKISACVIKTVNVC
ncbi:histone deacetylase 5 [Tanacetum coccineum]